MHVNASLLFTLDFDPAIVAHRRTRVLCHNKNFFVKMFYAQKDSERTCSGATPSFSRPASRSATNPGGPHK
jgi:hypothetical protein